MAGSSSVTIEARFKDKGATDGLKRVKASMEDVKSADGSLGWKGISSGSDRIAALGAGMTKAGQAMTIGVTAPLVATGGAAVSLAAGFESSMSQVQGALGDSGADMESLRALALKLGSDTVFSATEAGQAMVELAKGGMTEADIKGGALAASMDLAAAGQLNLSDAAAATVQMMGSFGLGASDAGRIANALAGAANASSADVSDLTQAMSQCSAQAHLAGWSLEDTSAALALFADHGVMGSDAGTSLKTMLQRLSAPTEESALAMQELGLQVRNSDGSMKSVADIAQELQGKLGGLSEEQRDAALQTIFGADASRAAAILMQSGAEGLEKYTAATHDSAAAERMATAQKGELAWAMENMQGSLETAGIALGTAIAPAVQLVAGGIAALAEGFANLPGPAQTAIAVALALVAALGPLLIVAGMVVSMIPAFTAGLAILGGAFTIPLAPIAAVVAAIAGVVAILALLWNSSETFRATVTAAVDAIRAKVQEAIAFLAPYVQEFMAQVASTVQTALAVLLPIIEGALTYIIGVVVPVVSSIIETVSHAFAIILATATSVMGGIQQMISGAWSIIKGIFQTVLGLIVGLATGDFSAMQAGIQSIMDGIRSYLSGVLNVIGSIFSGGWQLLVTIVEGVLNAIAANVSGTFNAIADVIGNVIGDAKNVVSDGLRAIAGFFSGLHLEFPHISLPHFSISGDFSLNPPSVPSIGIEWYQTGAIAMGPSVVGIGEAGPEAVVPLGGRHMDPFADAVAQRISGRASDGGSTIIYQVGDVKVDVSSMRDLATLQDFVDLLLAAKRANPIRSRG